VSINQQVAILLREILTIVDEPAAEPVAEADSEEAETEPEAEADEAPPDADATARVKLA